MLQVSSAHQQVQQWVLIYAGRLLPSLAATTVGACSMNYTPESAVTKEHAPGTCPWYISSWCAPKTPCTCPAGLAPSTCPATLLAPSPCMQAVSGPMGPGCCRRPLEPTQLPAGGTARGWCGGTAPPPHQTPFSTGRTLTRTPACPASRTRTEQRPALQPPYNSVHEPICYPTTTEFAGSVRIAAYQRSASPARCACRHNRKRQAELSCIRGQRWNARHGCGAEAHRRGIAPQSPAAQTFPAPQPRAQGHLAGAQ